MLTAFEGTVRHLIGSTPWGIPPPPQGCSQCTRTQAFLLMNSNNININININISNSSNSNHNTSNKAFTLCPDRRHPSPRGLCRKPSSTMLRRGVLL